MSTAAAVQEVSTPSKTAAIMLYSDNRDVRRDIRLSVGNTLADGTSLEWTEVATHERAMQLLEAQHFDLVIGDNETARLGGVGLTRQLRNEISDQPMVLLLLARQQDAWLAAWSGADAALQTPVDPFELCALVSKLLGRTEV